KSSFSTTTGAPASSTMPKLSHSTDSYLAEALDLPTVAVVATHEAIGACVAELQRLGIPVEPLAGDAVGHRADKHRFGQRTSVAELIARLATLQDGIHPVVIVVLRLQASG